VPQIPNATLAAFPAGSIDAETDTLRVLLLDDSTSYSFDRDADDTVQDVLAAASELSGTGYARQTLQNVTVTADDSNDEAVVDADDVTFTALDQDNGTIQAAVVYQQVGADDSTPGDDRVLAVFDDADVADLPLPTNGSDVKLELATDGLLAFSEV
jgi:hypothetical protein